MHWHEIYVHLVANGFYRDAINAVIIAVVGFAAGLFFGMRPFRKLQKHLTGISDALDTQSPGGLHDVVKAIQKGQHNNHGTH